MTTPVSSQFNPIQYFGNLDPYSYVVDNRPLQDLKQNIDATASVLDATVDAEKLATMAIGMAARGYAGSNIFIGRKTVPATTFLLTIDHGILLQDKDASLSDSRQFPHIGLQQVPYTFPAFSKPFVVGKKRCFTIQARLAALDNSISFFDPANPNNANVNEFSTVEYQVKQAVDVDDTDPSNFVAADLGWIEILHVTTFESDTQLNPDNVTRIQFYDDILREYQVDTFTTTTNQTVFSGISVDASKALVFINGVFQHPGNYVLDNASQITWITPLADGLTVDFVVMSGGYTVPTVTPGGTYDYQVDTHIASAGQQNFTGISVDANYAFVFVNGVFQADVVRVNPTEIDLPAPVALGTIVDFVVTIGGIGMPTGGVSGESLHQTTTGPTWQREVLTLEAASANTVGTLITYTCNAISFDPTTDLYGGRLVIVNNVGGFNGSNWTNDVPNVALYIGATSYPVKRPGNLPLQLNDVYDGMVLRFRNTTSSFEILKPGNELVLSSLRFATETTGTPDSITFTPHVPVKDLENGAILTIKVPGAGASTGTSAILTINRPSGGALALVVRRPNGAVLEVGDIVAGTNAVLMFDATLAMLILMNPAIQAATTPAQTLFPTYKRQTVLTGPIGQQSWIRKGNTIGETWTDYRQDSLTDNPFPALLRPYEFITLGVTVSSLTLASGNPSVTPYASFAAGYDDTGPIDYIEQLPSSSPAWVAPSPAWLGRTGGISSISYVQSTNLLTINYVAAHTWVSGQSVKLEGFFRASQQYFNGIWTIGSTTSNSITVKVPRAVGTNISSAVVGDFNNVKTLIVAYIYADRNPISGAITYGASSVKPIYIDPIRQGGYSTLATGWPLDPRTLSGQHVFNINDMVMTVGNGSTYSVVQRVFLGEAYLPASGMLERNVISYAYNGKFTHEIKTSSLEFGIGTDSPAVPVRFNQVDNCVGVGPLKTKALMVHRPGSYSDDKVSGAQVIFDGNYNGDFVHSGFYCRLQEINPMYSRVIIGTTNGTTYTLNSVGADGIRTAVNPKTDDNIYYVIHYERDW